MGLMNDLTDLEKQISAPVMAEVMEKLTLMLEPFAPYLAEELWEEQGKPGPVFLSSLAGLRSRARARRRSRVVIQVNGKLARARLCRVRNAARGARKARA